VWAHWPLLQVQSSRSACCLARAASAPLCRCSRGISAQPRCGWQPCPASVQTAAGLGRGIKALARYQGNHGSGVAATGRAAFSGAAVASVWARSLQVQSSRQCTAMLLKSCRQGTATLQVDRGVMHSQATRTAMARVRSDSECGFGQGSQGIGVSAQPCYRCGRRIIGAQYMLLAQPCRWCTATLRVNSLAASAYNTRWRRAAPDAWARCRCSRGIRHLLALPERPAGSGAQ
jgi:hypothetical protein